MISRRFQLLSCLAALAIALPAVAQRLPLRLMINDVAPYSWHRDEALVGMHVELMKALAEQAEMDLELRSGAYARLIRGLQDGWADGVLVLRGADFDQQARWVGRLHSFRSVVISRRAAPIAAVPELKGKLLGMARGAFYSDAINNDEEIRKFGLTDPFQGVRMLAVGRLDAVISSDYLLAYALRQTGLDVNQFAPRFVVNELSYDLYMRRDYPEPAFQRLRQALEQIERRGRLAAILKTYE